MKKAFRYIIFVLAISFLTTNCQDDSVIENDSGALGSASGLTALLSSVSANNTFTGTVIDSTSCFNIKLPVTVTANGQQLTVAGEGDYAAVSAIFTQSNNDEDTLQLTFPLTIVFPDYTQQVIHSQQEYDAVINACNTHISNIYNCFTIGYPVTVYGYNSNFQIENTYEFTTNQELYQLLQNLGANEYYSVAYPVSVYVNGAEVIVNNNAELEQVAADAVQNCTGDVVPPPCSNPGILTDELVVYMPFANTVNDLMGGVVTAPTDTTFVDDRYGNAKCALGFNGSQELKIASSAANALISGHELSISVWFRMQNTDGGDYELIFGKGQVADGDFRLSLYDLNKPLFATDNDNSVWASDADYLGEDTENWHHLAITLTAGLEASLYLDGVLQESSVFTNTGIGTEPMDYFIGTGFNGYLDDLRVYRKKLTPAEVQTLFEIEGDCNTCLE